MNTPAKDALADAIILRATEFARAREIPEAGICLYLAYYGALALADQGLRPLLQAGSAGWPRVHPKDDDGRVPTHFSYMWSPEHSVNRVASSLGLMVEMHVWIGLPDSGEIVDFSTGLFPAQAESIMGYDWPEDLLPPRYFWGDASELCAAFYKPEMAAIKHALGYVRDIYGAETLARLLEVGRKC